MTNYYNKSIDNLFQELNTHVKGLTSLEAKKRLEKYGRNEIIRKKKISKLKIFINQFKSFIILILIFASVFSIFIGEILDAIVILAIVFFNGIFGFLQDYKSEKSIEALKKLTSLKALVIRDNKEREIPANEIVPGDIVILETGNKIPADGRLIEAINLQTQEASLTGESVPIDKNLEIIKGKVSIGDQKNMVFSGTIVTKGRGRFIVTGTGKRTEIGKISQMIEGIEEEKTPLEKKLGTFGRRVGIIILIICAVIFVSIFFTETTSEQSIIQKLTYALLISISLAVAAVPEGLPAVITISLANGVKQMIKNNALLRKLNAVETLGSTNVICSDKTGTLTKNEMTVREAYFDDKIIKITGEGYDPRGELILDKKKINLRENEALLFLIGALCNNSKLIFENGEWGVIGDPTEGALLVSAKKAGLDLEELEKRYKRIKEIPFDPSRALMSTVYKDIKNSQHFIFTKGAVQRVIEICSKIQINGKIRKITIQDKERILRVNDAMAGKALRVLGFAYGTIESLEETTNLERELVFVGLAGMIDPPREDVKDAIKKCKSAGINVYMITGDHKETAIAIGRELGIEGRAITGIEIEKLNEEELQRVVREVNIYARISPEDKLKIVNALKENGQVVAMTGDGVNDAPALKKADIGISMGLRGTDVAKEASDLILTDDNFSSIARAVEEGRRIYDNIKKFVNYLLSCNLGEVLVIFLATLLHWPLPLTAIQLLWINLVTDGFPALALSMDPASKGIMKRAPRNPKENIITRSMMFSIISIGVLITIGTLALYKWSLGGNFENLIKAQTIAFTSLVVFEMVRLQIIRSNYNLSLFSNKYLLLAVGASLGLQFFILYSPLAKLFNVVPLGIEDWGLIFLVSIGLIVFNSFVKGFYEIIFKKQFTD